jgi:hypothetical protein
MFYKAIVGGVPIVTDQDPEKLEIPQQLEMLGSDSLGFRFSAYLHAARARRRLPRQFAERRSDARQRVSGSDFVNGRAQQGILGDGFNGGLDHSQIGFCLVFIPAIGGEIPDLVEVEARQRRKNVACHWPSC